MQRQVKLTGRLEQRREPALIDLSRIADNGEASMPHVAGAYPVALDLDRCRRRERGAARGAAPFTRDEGEGYSASVDHSVQLRACGRPWWLERVSDSASPGVRRRGEAPRRLRAGGLRLARAPLELGLGRVAVAATTAQDEQDLTTAQSLSLARELGEKLRVGVSTTPQRRMRQPWCCALDCVARSVRLTNSERIVIAVGSTKLFSHLP